ncbi:MAG: cytochrome c-type biogenesis protein CcmH [Gemmatimonadota bacterium]|nr:cytochrome c-type biogenesis protein CcmH [Gemmatimonadota bacterium]
MRSSPPIARAKSRDDLILKGAERGVPPPTSRIAPWSPNRPIISPRAGAFLVLFLLALAAAATPAQDTALAPTAASRQAANDPALERAIKEVSAQLRCPVCQGLSLQDSPSGLAQEMKDVVRDQLASGRTPDEVKAYFVSKYGEWVLLEPKPRGINIAVYTLPFLLLVAGAAVIAFSVRRWTRAPASAAEPMSADTFDDEELEDAAGRQAAR